MRVVSLFAGIGGIDLGLERAGMTTVAQVENDPWCSRILEKHWPTVPRWTDIHDVDPKELPTHDIVAGGFPCQPVSLAGARRAQDDSRWLWPEFFRIVRVVRPRYVLVENVPGLASAGMGVVLGDLASIGYDTEWQSIPAAAVGAPHLRWRIFIVAYPSGNRVRDEPRRVSRESRSDAAVARDNGQRREVAHTDCGVRTRRPWVFGPGRWTQPADSTGRYPDGGRFAEQGLPEGAETPGRQLDIGGDGAAGADNHGPGTIGQVHRPAASASVWTVEPDVGRVADGVPRRVDRLRGLGNAVVPQVAEFVGRLIMEDAAR